MIQLQYRDINLSANQILQSWDLDDVDTVYIFKEIYMVQNYRIHFLFLKAFENIMAAF